MPISIPRSEGQLPIYYSKNNNRDYIDEKSSPLYAFGYGLSYTKFEYSDLRIEKILTQDTLIKVACKIKNIGNKSGDEVVQLYVKDEVASVCLDGILLKDFKKIYLEKGESKIVEFYLSEDDLSIYNIEMREVVEEGDFKVLIGQSSDNIKLEGVFSL